MLLRVWRAPGAEASEQGSIDGSPLPGPRPTPAIGTAPRSNACREQQAAPEFIAWKKANRYRSAEQLFGDLGYVATPEAHPALARLFANSNWTSSGTRAMSWTPDADCATPRADERERDDRSTERASGQSFSDLSVHHMGPGLADGIVLHSIKNHRRGASG